MIEISGRRVGRGQPVYVVAEIGINHNGDPDIARKLMSAAADAGADAVKLQKREPRVCVPRAEWDKQRDTPMWGTLSYIEYRERMEFDRRTYLDLQLYAAEAGIDFFVSCWDLPSLEFALDLDMPAIKIPSAKMTDDELIRRAVASGRPTVVSTGMSTMDEIKHMVLSTQEYGEPRPQLAIMHCNSTYPAPVAELDLKVIDTWLHTSALMDYTIGYSGHEVGLAPTLAAAALGAQIIERHIALDRSMWGTDQAASVEPGGFKHMVKDIRLIEQALGSKEKRLHDSELDARRKLRGA